MHDCFIVNNFNIFIIIYSECARPFEKQTPERLPLINKLK
jgi:hypothetical protein